MINVAAEIVNTVMSVRKPMISFAAIKGPAVDLPVSAAYGPAYREPGAAGLQSMRSGTWQSGMIQSLIGSAGLTRTDSLGSSGALPGARVKVLLNRMESLLSRRRTPPCRTQMAPNCIGFGCASELGQTRLHRSWALRM